MRATGATILTGQTGVLFSFGRVKRELQPGFHIMLPFLQIAARVATRQRTLDLPSQRVVTAQDLVYLVDANLVFRVVDPTKALVEIDDLDKGMLQMLGLSVHEVIRNAPRERISASGALDDELVANIQARLAAWGVEVEHAGFTSVTPSPQTLRITQFARRTEERLRMLAQLEEGGVPHRRALALLGPRTRVVPRAVRARATTRTSFSRRRTTRWGWRSASTACSRSAPASCSPRSSATRASCASA